MQISRHADTRARQRSVPEHCIELLLRHGTPVRKCGHTFEIKIRKRDKDKIIHDLKRLIDAVEKSSHKALLVDDAMQTIITLYNR